MSFVNKVVLVTGAGSGIGEATALLLAGQGAQMVLNDKNPDTTHRIHEECLKARGKAPLLLKADITSDDDDVKKVEIETINHYGNVDILLNICRGIQMDSILEPNLKAFDDNLNLNLRSVYMMVTVFARHLMRSTGNIVHVGSVFGDMILSGQFSYNIAMSGLEYLTKVKKLELAPKGVRVNCVQPGYTKTDVSSNMCGGEKTKKTWSVEHFRRLIPLGRIIEANDIAQAIVFLASELAKNITGASIVVDGGLFFCRTSILEKAWSALK